MISIIHYISASRRLEEAKRTVYMMGGEEECPPMLLAQRDMVQLEKEYWYGEAGVLAYEIAVILIIALIAFAFYNFYYLTRTPIV